MFRVTGYVLRVTCYGLRERFTGYVLRVRFKCLVFSVLRVKCYVLHVTGYGLLVTD